MADRKREFHHILLIKLRDEVSEEVEKECIKRFAKLVDLVPTLKSFKWGKELSIANFHEGFTHIFELSFESAEGIAEYNYHPRHADFAFFFLTKVDKMTVVDFETTTKVPS